MEPKAIYELLAEQMGDAVLGLEAEDGIEPFAKVDPARIAEICSFLRDDRRLGFDQLMCLSGIDWDGYDETGKGKSVTILGYTDDGRPETTDRVAEGDLGVAYHLYSHAHDHKFTLQVRVPRAAAAVPTVSGVWPTASWHEREAWDLVGIDFPGHPDLRRILLEDSWVGHPLRKDYVMPDQWDKVPLEGQPYSENPFELGDDGTGGDSPKPAGDAPAEG